MTALLPNVIRDKVKIFNLMNPMDTVVFDLNPTKITVTYANRLDTRGTASSGGGSTGMPSAGSMLGGASGNTGNIYRGSKAAQLKFLALLDNDYANAIDINPLGDDAVRRRVDLLFSWTKPGGGSMLGALVGAGVAALTGGKINLTTAPTLLTFQWGDPFNGGLILQGYVTAVTATYTRFSAGGNPTRAEVDVTFLEEPASLLSALTNPTSGGVPGRKAHTVSAGENLQSIATTHYGAPGMWRMIADANGIDDPMRVKPGTTIYLPAPSEVELAAAATK